ncbi:MAG TPA: apolipoprotein N-acyltransferase [bacterium]|nr:apolipoprotein N-acyltransferase [bacterium]
MAVSAAAFVLAFPPYDLGPLAWVALVPLLASVWRRSPRDMFWTGYAWGLAAFGGVLWWLTGFGVLVWAFAAALLALAPAAALGAAAWAGTGSARRTVLWIPVTWTAVEWLRGQGSLGIPWALLGESQHAALAVSQIASLTGVYGVTFLVALVNAAGSLVLVRSAGVWPVAVTATALAAAVWYGSTALAVPMQADTTVALVQPAYPARMTWNPAQATRDLAVLRAMTHEAAIPRGSSQAALVVWPETASPVDIAGDPRMRAVVGAWARRDHVTLIATSLEGGLANSAFAVGPDGVIIGRYDKHRPVPFAEAGEQAGRGPAVLPTPAGALGVSICFESTFPDHARRAALDGAALLAVLTNDAWFDGRAAPLQHAAIAPFRAIEEGRFLLRAANAGPSEIIDPHGRVIASLPLGARGVLIGRVAPRTGLTWYARYGDVLAWAAVAASAFALAPRLAVVAIEEGRGPAFARLLSVSAIPLAALLVGDALARSLATPAVGGVPVPSPPLAVLAAAVLLSRRRPAAEAGFGRGFVPAAAVSLAVVAALALVAVRAFSAHGGTMPLTPPPGGWWWGTAVQIVIVGLAFEWWLRGLVFAAAAAWRGPAWAVAWSAALGAIAGLPRGAEAALWGIATGIAFGIARTRWAQVPAFALAHGAGNALFGFLALW